MTNLRKRPGEPLLARDWNALVAELATSIRAGQGIDVRRAGTGVTISLREDPAPKVYPARIVEVLGPAAGERESALNLGYRVARVGLPDSAAIDFEPEPVVGRIDYTGDVWLSPAPVGSPGLIREYRDDAGQSLPYFEVWKEAPRVDPACPEGGGEAAGGNAAGGLGFGARIVELAVAGPQEDANGPSGERQDETMSEHDWSASVEFEDFSRSGEEKTIPVPRGAQWASLQLVALGPGDGNPPVVEVVLGKSNTGSNPVFRGEASLLLTGQQGENKRVAYADGIPVNAVGHLHLRLRGLSNTSSTGSGEVHVNFA